ncbi:redox-regulated ATPase YchF, partial [Candidatus Woesebacteria bacterium CG22_combo_CG10-13_8_21_14_all_45_10]
NVNELLSAGGWKEAKERGKVKLEGRDYIMKDGDVVEFKIGS